MVWIVACASSDSCIAALEVGAGRRHSCDRRCLSSSPSAASDTSARSTTPGSSSSVQRRNSSAAMYG